ncbi:phosphotransferase family protein [Mycobacterium sp. OTB74]|uniref:phosphotransferase family protein n=1 Tax=Mycobacterium sp. OTB74 TaxID=1853452 RepID=UPI0024761122|nr:phosphotransferase family protein [Mycobacterium sp. OTB74]MDH6243263.1 aminoglycoside phosphotransferase (APT) family kinase protein [Mycobacterium sp. OTB74]
MAELTDSDLTRRLAPVGISALQPLPGGASSLTYIGRRDGQRVVVKVAPAGVEPIAHRDVLRQARVIRALAATDVPVPRVLHEDAGAPPAVPPLFVMSFLEGSSIEPLFDAPGDKLTDATVSGRFRSAAVTLARLHRLHPASVGLGDQPVLGPIAEIDRWSSTLRTVDQTLVPGWLEVGASLKAALPAPVRPTIVHGDFRLGNLLAEGEHIIAVIDWEIWSISDPRIDLGWFLINSDPETYRRDTDYRDAVPSAEQLCAAYSEALGADVTDVQWFQALACFKSAATWSLIVKHNRRRQDPDPELEAMAPKLVGLLQRARHLLEELHG